MQDEACLTRSPEVLDLGVMEYGACLALQRSIHAEVAAGARRNVILRVEHPPVLTLGRHADEKHLKFAEGYFATLGVPLFRIERGGEVTAHEPGQLVIYPILRLADFGLMPRTYISLLEQSVIAALARFRIEGATNAQHPGVWARESKVCAVGVRVKDRATLHGLALNVSNRLELFDLIVPCGIEGRRVTSLSRLLDRPVGVPQAAAFLTNEIRLRLRALPHGPDSSTAQPQLHGQ